MVIKAIVIDIGNVLIDETGVEARDFIAQKYGFPAKDFWEYTKKNLNKSYCGELRAEDFFKGLISELKLENVSAEDLIKDWLEIREQTSRVDNVVKETVEELKEKYLLGILSNSTELNEQVSVRKKCYNPFKLKILSYEVGCTKPGKKIYEILIKRLLENNINPNETVFIDDREENLSPAKQLGINTILFEDSEQMIRDLRNLGVKI